MVVKLDIWNCGMPPAQGRLPRLVPGVPSSSSAYLFVGFGGQEVLLGPGDAEVPSMTKVGEKM